jgi:hypothetical protein
VNRKGNGEKMKTLRDFVTYHGRTAIVIRNDHCGGVFRGHVDLWFGDTAHGEPVIRQALSADCVLIKEIPVGTSIEKQEMTLKIITTWMEEGEVVEQTTGFVSSSDPQVCLVAQVDKCVNKYEEQGIALVEKICRGSFGIDLFPHDRDAACKIRIESGIAHLT